MRSAPLAFFWAACLVELSAILALTDGQLLYSIDDPYIHLALAENIVRGTYGVNLGEFSSPSSSALWPLLLAPFQLTPFGSLSPLFINLAAGACCVVLLQQAARRIFATLQNAEATVALATVLLVVCSNTIALVFMGMEHTLQVLTTLAVVVASMVEHDERRVPRYLPFALVCAPWIRYEALAVTLPFGLYFWARGHRRLVGWSLGLSLLGLGAFSAFLLWHGEGPLPGSVVSKTLPVASSGIEMLGRKLLTSAQLVTQEAQSALLALFALVLAGCGLVLEGGRRHIAWALCAASLGHLVVGRIGAFGRYEAYIRTIDLIGLAWLTFEPLRRSVPTRAARLGMALLATTTLLLLSARYVHKTLATPWGARDMYRQQLQMHRFAADVYRKPVAVNDLGLVAYRNDAHVLDLLGLASKDVLSARRSAADASWMDTLARAHGVGLVMIYTHWFESWPDNWVGLGTLSMPSKTSAASNEVVFFATSVAAAAELRPLLRSFARSLPKDVTFDLTAGAE